jgi:hypothetical protein
MMMFVVLEWLRLTLYMLDLANVVVMAFLIKGAEGVWETGFCDPSPLEKRHEHQSNHCGEARGNSSSIVYRPTMVRVSTIPLSNLCIRESKVIL